MKHIILHLWASILVPVCLSAQNPSLISHAFQPSIFEMNILEMQVGTNKDMHFWCYGNEENFEYFRFSAAGELTKQYSIEPTYYLQDYQVQHTHDGALTLLNGGTCDVSLPPTFKKLDQNGNILWEVPFDFNQKHFFMPGADSTWWLFHENEVAQNIHYETGEVLATTNDIQPTFDQYIITTTGKNLAYGHSGLGLYRSDLSEQSFALSDQYVLDADNIGANKLVVLTTDSLYLLDSSLHILLSSNNPIGITGDYICGLEVQDNRIFMIFSSEQFPAWMELDSNLQLVQSKSIPDAAAFRVTRFEVDHNQLYLAGKNSSTVLGFKVLPVEAPAYKHKTDIAVVAITSPDSVLVQQNSAVSFSMKWDSVTVTLENKGQDTIHQVRLNSVLSEFIYICPIYGWFQKNYNSLALAPGQTKDIFIPSIGWGGITGFSNNGSICIWATIPQDSIDAVPANNTKCVQPRVKIVGTQDLAPISLKIYPNPAKEQCIIELPSDIKGPFGVRLFNPLGQLVQTTSSTEHKIVVSRNGLPNGFYHAHIQAPSGQSTAARLIFEE